MRCGAQPGVHKSSQYASSACRCPSPTQPTSTRVVRQSAPCGHAPAAPAVLVRQHAAQTHRQQCCRPAAAVPAGESDSSTADAASDALWSDDDVFEAFDEGLSSSGVAAAVDVAEQEHEDDVVSAAAAVGVVAQQQQQQSQQHPPATLPQHHSRHQRRFNQHVVANVLQQQQQQQEQYEQHQQQSGLQQLQPVVLSLQHVHLLQRVAGINSWTAAAALLQQERGSLQADHVALLWSRLTECRLERQQQAAAAKRQPTAPLSPPPPAVAAAAAGAQQSCQQLQQQRLQQQHYVMEQLCGLTAEYACSMGPQALTLTLQGLAAAVAAGKVAATAPTAPRAALSSSAASASGEGSQPGASAAVQLQGHGSWLLQQQLLQAAATCSPEQLSACLASGQVLGWCQQAPESSSSSDSPTPDCWCWGVLQAATQGQLGVLLQTGSLSSLSAAQLLHTLAGCAGMQLQAATVASMQQQQQEPEGVDKANHCEGGSSRGVLVQQLADAACRVLTPSAVPISSDSSSTPSDVALAAAVCSLQACAVLRHLPEPLLVEGLLAELQSQVAGHRLGAQQLLVLLQACDDLGIEPWPEWLQDCYNTLSSNGHNSSSRSSSGGEGLRALQPPQLLQLLLVLQRVTNLQPSVALLHQLAKLTAVHCSRYSLQQLASLSVGFWQLGYRPEPYWLKDYLAATAALLTAQQQQLLEQRQRQSRAQARGSSSSSSSSSRRGRQQMGAAQQRPALDVVPVASAAVLAQVLSGVGWLSAAPPPARWLTVMEQALLAAAAATPAGDEAADQQQQQQQPLGAPGVSRLPADSAAVVAAVLSQWRHTPTPQLQQVLAASLLEQHTQGPGSGRGGRGVSRVAQQSANPSTAAVVSASSGSDGDGSRHLRASSSQQQDTQQAPAGMAISSSSSSSSVLWPGANRSGMWDHSSLADLLSSSRPDASLLLANTQQPAAAAAARQHSQQQQQLQDDVAATPCQHSTPSRHGGLPSAAAQHHGNLKLTKSWYRAKLLQLMKSSSNSSSKKRQKQPVLAVL